MLISQIGTSGTSAAHSGVVLCSWTVPEWFPSFPARLLTISGKIENSWSIFMKKQVRGLNVPDLVDIKMGASREQLVGFVTP